MIRPANPRAFHVPKRFCPVCRCFARPGSRPIMQASTPVRFLSRTLKRTTDAHGHLVTFGKSPMAWALSAQSAQVCRALGGGRPPGTRWRHHVRTGTNEVAQTGMNTPEHGPMTREQPALNAHSYSALLSCSGESPGLPAFHTHGTQRHPRHPATKALHSSHRFQGRRSLQFPEDKPETRPELYLPP